jgi:fructokinase
MQNKTMNTIFAIGETVYDIIFDQESRPVAAKPGGSMLNSAVSLGRCGLKVEMITELGDDPVGKIVLNFLTDNGVSTSFISPAGGFKTPVSLAFLDEQGNAQYSFYKNYPDERLNITWPETNKGDVVLFGSFYSLNKAVREKIIPYLEKAKNAGGMIVYDPNIRRNHLGEIRELMDFVEENISLADIVRGSDEDFENLLGLNNYEEIFKRVKQAGCGHLVITKGKQGADLLTDNFTIHVPAKEIEVVSTIGAGDAFNAGIIYGMVKNGLTVHDLVNINQEKWKEILGFGVTFAAEVCKSYDNYVPTSIISIAHGPR